MKKTLSIFLAVIMLLSCCSVVIASAESGDIADMIYSEESIAASEKALKKFAVNGLPEQFSFKFEERYNADNAKIWNNVSLLGMGLDFLYSAEGSFIWANLDVYQKDEKGNILVAPNGNPVLAITRDDISLAFTNVNIYLQRIFYYLYGGIKIYNVNNAVALANLVGKILNPDFITLDAENYKNLFTNEVPSSNEFYRAITKLSGLDVIITNNWIPKGKAFCEPVATLLGGGYIDFFDEYYTDGLILGSKILEGMVSKFLTVGPIDYVYDLLVAFTSEAYSLFYCQPILSLFSLKTARTDITEEKLTSLDGLLHLIFCDCDALENEGCYGGNTPEHFVLYRFPSERFKKTTDKTDRLIFLYYYLNLCGRYMDNASFAEELKVKIANTFTITSDHRAKISALVDGFLLGDFESAVDEAIIPLYKENIVAVENTLLDRIKNAFLVLMKKIADYFDYLRKLFNGEIQYGQGNSPFN